MQNEEAPFDTIVSLGGLCQVAYQIENRFGFRIHSPFDWLVAPFNSVGQVFADDGARFGESIRVGWAGEVAICTEYGVAYQHEFPRDGARQVNITAVGLAKCRDKLQHKYRTMTERVAASKRVLFLRMSGHHDSAGAFPYLVDPEPLTTADVNRLCGEIEAKFPGLEFALAVATFPGFTEVQVEPEALDARARMFLLEGDAGDEWQGNEQSWAPVFEAYPIQLERGAGETRQQTGSDIELLHG